MLCTMFGMRSLSWKFLLYNFRLLVSGDVLGNTGGVFLGLHLDFPDFSPKDSLLSSFLLTLGVIVDVAVVDDDDGDNDDFPDIVDSVLVLVIFDIVVDFNPFSFVPEDDGDILVRSFPDAEDDCVHLAFQKSRVGWVPSGGSGEGLVASYLSSWIFLIS